MQFPTMTTFNWTHDPKTQALKVMEEGAEIVDAVKSGSFEDVCEEIADSLQATANLCVLMGITKADLDNAYYRVRMKNYERAKKRGVDSMMENAPKNMTE